jgi:phosphoribosylformylglycinamidine synthase I
MKSAVIVFPGSNCDRDAIEALKKTGSEPQKIWYQETSLPKNLDLVVIPGGFSYGDYLRSGAMAAISPVMQEIKKRSKEGLRIIGICNGFQILTESGLLEGVLVRNKKIKFVCKDVNLRVETTNNNFTSSYKEKEIINIPIAHMDGDYFAKPDVIKSILDNEQIAFKYVNNQGQPDQESNPNGSIHNIAGIFNKNKTILGMMPHPERAIDQETGSKDGLKIFESLFNSLNI